MTKQEQIVNYILDQISKENFKPEEPLPSEHFLVTKFRVSRGTVRSGIAELSKKGIIRSSKGSGYFWNEDSNLSKIKAVGSHHGFTEQKIISVSKPDLNHLAMLIETLDLKTKTININDFLPYIKVFYKDGNPVRYVNSYINKSKFKEIDFDEINISLTEYAKKQGLTLHKLSSKLTAELKTDYDKEIMFSDTNDYVISRKSTLYSSDRSIIEISEHRICLDHFNTSYVKHL